VTITKVADRTSATVGEQITYIVTVTNAGPAVAANVVVVDPLPPQETLVSVNDPACSGTTVITCSFGELAVGASRAVTVVTIAKTEGTASNVASVSTSTPESNSANNRAEVTTPITGVFRPPAVPTPVCTRLKIGHGPLVAGRSAVVTVAVRGTAEPVVVSIHGAGVSQSKETVAGHARFVVTPRAAGVLRVRVVQPSACPAALAEVPVPGEFRPPVLTG
jgi:uncharacterized repeat protein (TIGR01451 family)